MELPADYTAARNAFLVAAGRLGARTAHHIHPGWGPVGEELAVDTAWIGPRDADAVLVVVSGTHGVEGFAGSACQTHWLQSSAVETAGDEGVAVLLIHAFNPYGFAWVRRVDEGNVDLNRNFVDFDDPPHNAAYEELHEALVPTSWDDDARARSRDRLLEFVAAHGIDATQEAITRGQYRHPDGLYFGGTAPAWSARMMRHIWQGKLSSARKVAVLDLHTGLGEPGTYELISHCHADTEAFRRQVAWYGDEVVSLHTPESVSAELVGEWMPGVEHLVEAEVTAVAIEWGTVDPVEVLVALQADNWLHLHGDPKGPDAAAIKAQLRAAFAPAGSAWLATVLDQFDAVSARALAGLTST